MLKICGYDTMKLDAGTLNFNGFFLPSFYHMGAPYDVIILTLYSYPNH